MKKLNHYIAYLAVLALCFTSCSKEESGILDSETAKLSFGAIVNDLAATSGSSRQALGEFPACSTDDPSYVRIVLKQGNTEIVGTAQNPYRVDLAPGEIFTVEDSELELPAGEYVLDYFAVYNAGGEVIWLAPRGGDYASFVDTPLPLTIDLRAGVKKYVDVDVLCFDNRDVNLYGYQFFEIDTNAAVDFCFFANFCDGDGKHYPARYRLDVWLGTNANGTVLYTNRINTTDQNEDGDFYARALCVALPVNDGNRNDDYIFYQLTLLDWDENYGDVETNVISGTLSLADIEANFGDDGEVEYEHLRFGCGDDGNGGVVDSDGDGLPDNVDNCPNEAGPVSNNGCPETACDQTDPALDCDNDGTPNRCDEDNPNWGTFDCDNDTVLNAADNCPRQAGPASNNGCPETACDQTDPALDCDNDGTPNRCDEDNPNWGTFDCDNDTVLNAVDNCPGEAGPASNNGCPETACDQTNPALDCDNDGIPNRCDEDNPNWATFDCDNDTVLNAADNCPNEAGPASNNGCPVETCEMEEADAGCSIALLEGTTNWTMVTDPGGESPEFFGLLSGGEPVGSVTVFVDNGNVVVIGNLGFGDFVLDDYLVEVSQNADGSGSVCVAVNNVIPATGEDPDLFEIFNETTSFNYPVYVRITANVCN